MFFTAPAVLLGLIALPGIYFLLRITPPAPRKLAFPPLELLRGLAARERTPHATPLWLLLLRLLAAAMLILGLAGPALHPPAGVPGHGPVLIVIDNGWASAADWPARRDAALAVIAAADAAGRSVGLLATARDAGNAAPRVQGLFAAGQARQVMAALQPEPWPVDRAGAAAALADAPRAARIYVADGITDGAGFAAFMTALHPDRIFAAGPMPPLLTPLAPDAAGHLQASTAPGQAVLAQAADGGVLARAVVSAAGAAVINLPLPLGAKVARLVLAGPSTAGGTLLLDGAAHASLIGLAGGGGGAETPYLGALFFLRRALPPGAQAVTGSLAALIADKPDAIILADLPLDPAQQALAQNFIAAGGDIIRFAGPLTADAPDPLTPDTLLAGDRRLGGALTWAAPQGFSPFPPASPFAGLTAGGAAVARQVLADPTQLDSATLWAVLRDGTPIILGRTIGRGVLVSVLTTANADWSNLALSGLYPALLARLVALSHGAPPKPDQALANLSSLDAFGNAAPPAAASLTFAALAQTQVSPLHPPGYYGTGAQPVALNIGGHVPPVVAARLPDAAPLSGQRPPVTFGPALIATAALLLAADLVISLLLRGKLRLLAPAALLLLIVQPALAQNAALATTLAYVTTGDAGTDQTSADGLGFLAAIVSAHSSAQLGPPAGVTPGNDDLNLYPLLYWPILAGTPPPSAAACAALTSYMQHGGLLVVDTQGGDASQPGSGAGFAPGAPAALARDTACLGLPPLEPLTTASVLAHCFFIVPDFPGRFTGAPVLIATAAARDADGVTPIIIGQNDWAGAWARDASGSPEQTPIPGGDAQRSVAERFGTNLVIYALTGNYKADQSNLPELLDRLGQ